VTDRLVGERVRGDITRLSGARLDSSVRRSRVIERLRRAVPVDAVFFASCDPSTLLFTDVSAEAVLLPLAPLFLRNEFLSDDVNKFRSVASSPSSVATLDQATGGHRIASARYREILQPARLGDEMRVALRSGGVCWGFMCLHREDGTGFNASEVAFVDGLSRPIADGLRSAVLRARLTQAGLGQPGVIVLSETLELEGATAAGEALLEELDWKPPNGPLPLAVLSAAARLLARDRGRDGPIPTIRLLSRAGRWLVIHASHLMETKGGDKVTVIVEAARPDDFIPLMLTAHRLSRRESEVAVLVLRGQSTKEISRGLRLSENSVQDNLKAIFGKLEVHSRRELAAYLQGQAQGR